MIASKVMEIWNWGLANSEIFKGGWVTTGDFDTNRTNQLSFVKKIIILILGRKKFSKYIYECWMLKFKDQPDLVCLANCVFVKNG